MTPPNSIESTSLPDNSILLHKTNVEVNCEDRWQVYYRLQELDVRCQCSGYQPLEVDIQTVTEAIQLWSIVSRVSEPRQVLVNRLTASWQRPCGKPPA